MLAFGIADVHQFNVLDGLNPPRLQFFLNLIGPESPGESQLTSNGVTATAIYYYDVTLMEKMANLLGKPDDARKYQELAARIKQAFNRTFWNPSTRTYDRNSQAANAVALYMGLTTPENRQQVFDNLIADIRGRNNALTAGDVGYRYVLRALEAGGARMSFTI